MQKELREREVKEINKVLVLNVKVVNIKNNTSRICKDNSKADINKIIESNKDLESSKRTRRWVVIRKN